MNGGDTNGVHHPALLEEAYSPSLLEKGYSIHDSAPILRPSRSAKKYEMHVTPSTSRDPALLDDSNRNDGMGASVVQDFRVHALPGAAMSQEAQWNYLENGMASPGVRVHPDMEDTPRSDAAFLHKTQGSFADRVALASSKRRLNASIKGSCRRLTADQEITAELEDDRSWYLFTPESAIRRWSHAIVTHGWFELAVLVIICFNSVLLVLCEEYDLAGVEVPCSPPVTNKLACFFLAAEFFFVAVYSIEFVLKSVVNGFVVGEGAYLRDHWNQLDFLVLLASWGGCILYFVNIGNRVTGVAVATRMFRILRTLRTIQLVDGLRVLVNSLLRAVPLLLRVMVLFLVVVVVFGLLGVQLFSGELSYRCVRTSSLPANYTQASPRSLSRYYANLYGPYWMDNSPLALQELDDPAVCGACAEGYTCVDLGRNTYHNFQSFDHFGYSVLSMFVVITGESWGHLMDFVTSATTRWSATYFLVLVLVGTNLLMNLLLAVIKDSFSTSMTRLIREQRGQKMKVLKQAVEFLALQAAPLSPKRLGVTAVFPRTPSLTNLFPVLSEKFSALQEVVFQLVIRKSFQHTFALLTLCNTLLLSSVHANMRTSVEQTIEVCYVVLNTAFAVESILKIIGFGVKKFAKNRFDVFDLVVVMLGVVDAAITARRVNVTALRAVRTVRAFRLMRVIRIFRLARYMDSLRTAGEVLVKSLSVFLHMLMLLCLFVGVFAVMGMQLFKPFYSTVDEAILLQPRRGFRTFYESCLSVFQALTREGWVALMYDAMLAHPVTGSLFYVAWICVGSYTLLSLLVSVVLDNFERDYFSRRQRNTVAAAKRKRAQAKRKQQTWQASVGAAALFARNLFRAKELVPGTARALVGDNRPPPALLISARDVGPLLSALGEELPPGLEEKLRARLQAEDDNSEVSVDEVAAALGAMADMVPPVAVSNLVSGLAMWRLYDVDNSGFVSTREMETVLTALGKPVSEAELASLITRLDMDGSGDIHFVEFLRVKNDKTFLSASDAVFGVLGPDGITLLRQAFSIYDTDNSGFINKEELGEVMESIGQRTSGWELSQLMSQMDYDDSGQISFFEFVRGMARIAAREQAELTGGFLDANELGAILAGGTDAVPWEGSGDAPGGNAPVLSAEETAMVGRNRGATGLEAARAELVAGPKKGGGTHTSKLRSTESHIRRTAANLADEKKGAEFWGGLLQRGEAGARWAHAIAFTAGAGGPEPRSLGRDASSGSSGMNMNNSSIGRRASGDASITSGRWFPRNGSNSNGFDSVEGKPYPGRVSAGDDGTLPGTPMSPSGQRYKGYVSAPTSPMSGGPLSPTVAVAQAWAQWDAAAPDGTLRSRWADDKSLGLFGMGHPVRVLALRAVTWKYTEWALLALIFGSCVCLALETPAVRREEGRMARALFVTDVVFTLLFTVEMMLKVVACGLVRGRYAYLRTSWNVLDAFVVLSSIANVVLEGVFQRKGGHAGLNSLRIIRLVRALRPMRAIARGSQTRRVVNALLQSAGPILNVTGMVLFIAYVFSILGLNLFAGSLFHCERGGCYAPSAAEAHVGGSGARYLLANYSGPCFPYPADCETFLNGTLHASNSSLAIGGDIATIGANGTAIDGNATAGHGTEGPPPGGCRFFARERVGVTSQVACEAGGHRWVDSIVNFNHIGRTAITLFIVATNEAWTELMDACVDVGRRKDVPGRVLTPNVDIRPRAHTAQGLFFVVYIVVVQFLLLNLFAGATYSFYIKQRDDESESTHRFLTKSQREWVAMQARLAKELERVRKPTRRGRLAEAAARLVESTAFQSGISLLILLQLLLLCTDHKGESRTQVRVITYSSYAMTLLLAAEMALRLLAVGVRSILMDSWHQFDLIVLALALLEAGIRLSDDTPGIHFTMLRILRVGRFFRNFTTVLHAGMLVRMLRGVRKLQLILVRGHALAGEGFSLPDCRSNAKECYQGVALAMPVAGAAPVPCWHPPFLSASTTALLGKALGSRVAHI
eukprot:jgi/Mesvir1/17858/Mv12940-RA.3